MLNEGWDVLNLFDIVRLDESEGKKRDVVKDIQLIGRGVRYFPFVYNEHEKNKRKFDNDLEDPLRVLEEFFKLIDRNSSMRFKKLRYRFYHIEKEAVEKITKLCNNKH